MKVKRFLLTMSALGLAGLALAGCSNSANSNKASKTLTIMESADLSSLDQSASTDVAQWNVLYNSMEGLYRTNPKGKILPGIATKVVKPTDKGKTYTFPLRKNARWSNGQPVTAQDFVYAWRRGASDKSQSGYNYIFSGIKNADAVSTGKAPESSLGVKALNKHTLQVQLQYPMPYFLQKMVMVSFFPQNIQTVKKYGKAYGTTSSKVVYDGPFKAEGWTGTNNSWTLVKNKYYYDKSAIKLNKIKMDVVKDPNTAHQMFQQNQLDDATITGTTAQGLQKNKDLQHITRGGNYFLRPNMRKSSPMSNADLRNAVSLALDKKELCTKVLADGSKPDNTFVAPDIAKDPTTGKDFATENEPSGTYNVSRAKALWKQGLKQISKKEVTLQLVGDDQTISKNVCQFVQSQLEGKLTGCKVSVRNIPFKSEVSQTTKGNFDLEYTLWISDFADPISTLQTLQLTNAHNRGQYKSARYNELLQDATSVNATNQKKYWADMRAAEKQVDQDKALIPLYSMVESHLVNPKVKGIMWNPVGVYDYTRAEIK